MNLTSFQTSDGWFTIAPFDHRGSLATALKLDLKTQLDREKFLHIKHLFMQILSPHVSAVLTDPEYGISTLHDKDPQCGLFLSLEESGYSSDKDAMTILRSNWGVSGVKQHSAGAKLLVYINPKSSTADAKLALIESVANDCATAQVPFLVEPVLYALDDSPLWEKEGDESWIATHLQVCEQIAPFCDILKIQYPGSQAACATVSTLHPNWILLSRGAAFDIFKEYLRTAARQGCKGFAAGRAVWQEIEDLDAREWEGFLRTTAVPRLQELIRILRSANTLA